MPAPTSATPSSASARRISSARSIPPYAQYSYEDWTGQNQGVGGQSLAAAGYNNEYREDDFVAARRLDALGRPAEPDLRWSASTTPAATPTPPKRRGSMCPAISSPARRRATPSAPNTTSAFTTWPPGRTAATWSSAASAPRTSSRRAFDDETNALGTYTFGPTLAADGVTVLQTALQNYAANLPSGFSANTGDTHFIYHQQEMGAFIQDQLKLEQPLRDHARPRYDWQNFLATRRLGFSPRVSLRVGFERRTQNVVRGGGGIYYDRFGSGPLLDLARYADGAAPGDLSVA